MHKPKKPKMREVQSSISSLANMYFKVNMFISLPMEWSGKPFKSDVHISVLSVPTGDLLISTRQDNELLIITPSLGKNKNSQKTY